MKKLLILIAVLLLPLSAMAGVAAFMSMDEANDQDLAQVTGQTGVSIEIQNMNQSIGTAGWEDNDGFAGAPSTGAVVLGTITMSGVDVGTVIIDAGTIGAASSRVSIVCTAGIYQGTIDVAHAYIQPGLNAAAAAVNDLGRVRLTEVDMTFDRILISGH